MKRIIGSILLLLVVATLAATPAGAQCRPVGGVVPLRLTVHGARAIDDPEGFWQGMPELFVQVWVEGIKRCESSKSGSSLRMDRDFSCDFNVLPPYDPVEIRLELREDDSFLGFADDVMDISGQSGETALEFYYSPRCNRISGKTLDAIPGCHGEFGFLDDDCSGRQKTYTGGRDGDGRANISFSIATADGLPVENNDLQLSNLEVVQVTPSPEAVIANKPTIVRLDVASTYGIDVSPKIEVLLRDKAGAEFPDDETVTLAACATTENIEFFVPGGVLPQDGNFELTVRAEVDPTNQIDCSTIPCQAHDCRKVNNRDSEKNIPLELARQLRVAYRPMPVLYRTDVTGGPLCDPYPPVSTREDVESVAYATEAVLQELFPLVDARSLVDMHRVDWGGASIPQVGIAAWDLGHRLSGFDRLVGVGRNDYFDCQFIGPWSARSGASAGEFGRHLVLVESEDANPDLETTVHELGHTYDLSEAECDIGYPASAWECEDEYEFAPDPAGMPTTGYRISTSEDMDGNNCIMGATNPGPLNHWIDEADYNTLIEWLSVPIPREVLYVRLHLELGLAGNFISRRWYSRFFGVPDHLLESGGGRARGSGSTSIYYYDAADVLIDSIDFTPEHYGEGGEAMFGYPDPDTSSATEEGFTSVDFGLVIPLPAAAERIALVRRVHDIPSDTTTELIVDSLSFLRDTVFAELIAPTIPVPVSPGDEIPIYIRTGLVPSGDSTATAGDPEVSTMLFISPDNGQSWIPLAHDVRGGEYLWKVEDDGRYMVRVFTTGGFETDEATGEVDSDFDGCPDSIDPQPEQPDPDTSDGDGIADFCDNCLVLPNPTQANRDNDSVGDACDNCPLADNESQTDTDLDQHGDACDCLPLDPDTWELPGPVTGLTVNKSVSGDDYTDLAWDSLAAQAGPSVVYDIVSGDLALLPTQNRFLDAQCLWVDAPQNLQTVFQLPPAPGQGFWYLVRGQTPCGRGTHDSGSPNQVGGRDDPIDQGAAPCA